MLGKGLVGAVRAHSSIQCKPIAHTFTRSVNLYVTPTFALAYGEGRVVWAMLAACECEITETGVSGQSDPKGAQPLRTSYFFLRTTIPFTYALHYLSNLTTPISARGSRTHESASAAWRGALDRSGGTEQCGGQ